MHTFLRQARPAEALSGYKREKNHSAPVCDELLVFVTYTASNPGQVSDGASIHQPNAPSPPHRIACVPCSKV